MSWHLEKINFVFKSSVAGFTNKGKGVQFHAGAIWDSGAEIVSFSEESFTSTMELHKQDNAMC